MKKFIPIAMLLISLGSLGRLSEDPNNDNFYDTDNDIFFAKTWGINPITGSHWINIYDWPYLYGIDKRGYFWEYDLIHEIYKNDDGTCYFGSKEFDIQCSE